MRRQSQILICPGCQDTVDWMSDLDRCSRCSSVHLVKRLGEVECRDCGAIVPPEGSGATDFAETLGEEPGGAGPAVAGRGPDLSEEVARALDRVLSRSLVSQSIQRAPAPEGRPGSGGGSGAGAGWRVLVRERVLVPGLVLAPGRGGIVRPAPRPIITRRLILVRLLGDGPARGETG